MIVVDEDLLYEFRGPGDCELCGRWAPKREPHHCFTVGASGGNLDVRENVAGVSQHETFVCQCHRLFHDGKIPRRCVLAVVALREGRTVDQLERFVFALRRAAKGTSVDDVRREVFGSQSKGIDA